MWRGAVGGGADGNSGSGNSGAAAAAAAAAQRLSAPPVPVEPGVAANAHTKTSTPALSHTDTQVGVWLVDGLGLGHLSFVCTGQIKPARLFLYSMCCKPKVAH